MGVDAHAHLWGREVRAWLLSRCANSTLRFAWHWDHRAAITLGGIARSCGINYNLATRGGLLNFASFARIGAHLSGGVFRSGLEPPILWSGRGCSYAGSIEKAENGGHKRTIMTNGKDITKKRAFTLVE